MSGEGTPTSRDGHALEAGHLVDRQRHQTLYTLGGDRDERRIVVRLEDPVLEQEAVDVADPLLGPRPVDVLRQVGHGRVEGGIAPAAPAAPPRVRAAEERHVETVRLERVRRALAEENVLLVNRMTDGLPFTDVE